MGQYEPIAASAADSGSNRSTKLRGWYATDKTLLFVSTLSETPPSKDRSLIRSNHARMFNYPEDAPYCHLHWIAEAEGNPLRSRWVECLRDLEWIR